MVSKKKLPPNKQCVSCPFRKDTTVSQIPNYDPQQHESLSLITLRAGHETDHQSVMKGTKVMACHHRHQGLCVGWGVNQVKVGNVAFKVNIVRGLHNESFPLEPVGKQVETFEETFK